MSTLEALQKALAAEHVAVYGYGVAGAELRGSRRAHARTDWKAHRAARDELRRLVREHGGRPTPAAPAYDLPSHLSDGRAAERLATRLEEGVTAAYAGLVATGDTRLRRFAARAMRESAIRASHWRGSAEPFPGLPHEGAAADAPQRFGASGEPRQESMSGSSSDNRPITASGSAPS
ncbi:MAG: ferritin-like domain-containing protein [Streptosporangiaceae bacterium]